MAAPARLCRELRKTRFVVLWLMYLYSSSNYLQPQNHSNLQLTSELACFSLSLSSLRSCICSSKAFFPCWIWSQLDSALLAATLACTSSVLRLSFSPSSLFNCFSILSFSNWGKENMVTYGINAKTSNSASKHAFWLTVLKWRKARVVLGHGVGKYSVKPLPPSLW